MSPRIVVVHERFTEIGGSEHVAEQLAMLRPNTRVFAPLVDRAVIGERMAGVDVSSSALQHLYRSPGQYAHLLPLLPMAMAGADLSDADLVLTSHHAFANRVRVPDGVPLVSYTHSPARWMWDASKLTGESGGRFGAASLRGFAVSARRSDRAAAQRVDLFIANSQTVAGRILSWWGRHATVINPPVDVEFFTPAETATHIPAAREDFFLVAGRLVPYKRIEVAVAAANELGCRLVIAGRGRALQSLQASAGPTVEFVGAVSNPDLRGLYRRCRALLFPGEEDFGIVPVEAQACGAPVIASRVGGATESVIDGVTGTLVDIGPGDDPVTAFARAMESFEPADFDSNQIRANAERFSTDRFRRRMNDLLASRFAESWPDESRRPIAAVASA